uniref:Uncharacterized protein n=1 Tax=Meloidogyne enterolobii TaxID=390850 RepID=A0A6V7UUR7_MELEN|nr:unnamed protein product [Meloidogyne enterolobii]
MNCVSINGGIPLSRALIETKTATKDERSNSLVHPDDTIDGHEDLNQDHIENDEIEPPRGQVDEDWITFELDQGTVDGRRELNPGTMGNIENFGTQRRDRNLQLSPTRGDVGHEGERMNRAQLVNRRNHHFDRAQLTHEQMRSMSLARRQNITSRGFNPRDPEPTKYSPPRPYDDDSVRNSSARPQ